MSKDIQFLECQSNYSDIYRGKRIGYETGQVIEADPDLAEFLERNAPGQFKPYKPPKEEEGDEKKPAKKKAPAKPKADKQVKAPAVKK